MRFRLATVPRESRGMNQDFQGTTTEITVGDDPYQHARLSDTEHHSATIYSDLAEGVFNGLVGSD